MSFEIDPPDEPCPDCGSTHHRQCDIKPKFDCCACLKFGPPVLGFVQCPCNCHKQNKA
jgi:hypothetical protein